MKTFHRLMYENLTPEEWRELLKVGNVWAVPSVPCSAYPDRDFTDIKPYVALAGYSFSWRESPQGPDYWKGVYRRLDAACVRWSMRV